MPTMPRPISLAHLTVLDTTPPELITVADAAGFRTVGIRLTATQSVGVPPYDVLHEGPMLRETVLRLKDTGVSVLDTEFLRFEPEHPIGVPEGFLEVSARLGAKHVLVMSAEPQEGRTLRRLGGLGHPTAPDGLTVRLELRGPPPGWPGSRGLWPATARCRPWSGPAPRDPRRSRVEVEPQPLVRAAQAAQLVVDELVQLAGQAGDRHRLVHAPPALDGRGQILEPEERRARILAAQDRRLQRAQHPAVRGARPEGVVEPVQRDPGLPGHRERLADRQAADPEDP